MQNNALRVANLLIHQKRLDVCSLISTQLNDFAHLLVFLNGTVAGKVLFECFADAFDIQVVSETGYSRDTLASVSLLHTDVHFFFRRSSALVARVLKRVCLNSHNPRI